MVYTRPLTLAAAFVALAATPLGAEAISPVYKVVRSGALAPMGFHYYLEEGCRSPGPVAINLLVPPENGTLSEASRTAHPSYPAFSPLAACNRSKVPGVQVYYRSRPGYTGPDRYVVERVFPNGDAQRFRIDVTVR